MLLDQLSLACGERPWFQENSVGDAKLSDVVQPGTSGKIAELLVRPAHRPRRLPAQLQVEDLVMDRLSQSVHSSRQAI